VILKTIVLKIAVSNAKDIHHQPFRHINFCLRAIGMGDPCRRLFLARTVANKMSVLSHLIAIGIPPEKSE